MIIALVVNYTKPQAKELAEETTRFLQQRGVTVVGPGAEAIEEAGNNVDFIVSLGGDGSMKTNNDSKDCAVKNFRFSTLKYHNHVTVFLPVWEC